MRTTHVQHFFRMFPTPQIQFIMLLIQSGLFTEHISKSVFSASMLQQWNIHVAQGYVFKNSIKITLW